MDGLRTARSNFRLQFPTLKRNANCIMHVPYDGVPSLQNSTQNRLQCFVLHIDTHRYTRRHLLWAKPTFA